MCIDACPVDAIVGAAKLMHTVLTEVCTGCELCLPPCPIDCISMVGAGSAWTEARAHKAREQLEQRNERLARLEEERSARLAAAARSFSE